MNKEKVKDILEWYGYKNVYFDCQDGDRIFYFRTENKIHNYVIKLEEKEDSIDIYQATEDFYEKYEMDFYDFKLEARFTIDEINKCLSK